MILNFFSEIIKDSMDCANLLLLTIETNNPILSILYGWKLL